MKIGVVFTCAALLIAASPACSEQPLWVTAAGVIDGDTLTLDDGGAVRLAGIEAPSPPFLAENGRRWPLAEAATALLIRLAQGHRIALRDVWPAPDRYGRLVAHAFADETVWLQGELLSAGLARVRTTPHDRERAAAMLALERTARNAGLGMWTTRTYDVRPADPAILKRDSGSFQIVKGRVRRAEKRSGTVYLDFGDDWRSDVTARIGHEALRLFAKAKTDPLALAGKEVRLRGWIEDHYGPLILITHPEQIEEPEE